VSQAFAPKGKEGPLPVERPPMAAGNDQVDSLEVPEDFYDRIKDRIRERIAGELRFAGQVVDLGCGSCELTRFLARENRQRVVGVDISDGGFPEDEDAREEVDCLKADARRLDFVRDGSVDAVLSVYALHEMEKPVEVLREARRALRGGGVILVVDFPRGSLAQRLWDENYYTSAEAVEMLGQAGFVGIESRLVERNQLIWAKAHKAPAEGETL